ncbi:homoserine dehydrogenase, partial [Phyllobacterium brassicacearum]
MATNVALTGLARDMQARADTGRPIRIGLIGSGEMGTDIVTRVAHMPGIEIGAISELNLQGALKAVDIAYQEEGHSREVSNASALNAAMEAGKIAITDNADLILENDLIDVVIDATGVPAVGAEIGLKAMEHGKHLVMMNVEADVTIGA